MDLLAVVLAKLLFLLLAPAPDRLFNITTSVLGTHHKADLTGWVGRNGCVCVLDHGEDLFARLLQIGDELEVQPLILRYTTNTLARSLVGRAHKKKRQRRGLTTLRGDHATIP
jgi:hypothetical protein